MFTGLNSTQLIIKQRDKFKEGRAVQKATGKNAHAFDSMVKYPDAMFDKTHVNSLCSLERMQKAADLHKTNRMRNTTNTNIFSLMEDSKLAALNESAIEPTQQT